MSQAGVDGLGVVGGAFFFAVIMLFGSCSVDLLTSKIVKVEDKCLNKEMIIKKDIYNTYDYFIGIKGEAGGDRVEHEILEGHVEPTGEKYGYWPDGYHYRQDGYRLKQGRCIEVQALINRFGSIKQLNFIDILLTNNY